MPRLPQGLSLSAALLSVVLVAAPASAQIIPLPEEPSESEMNEAAAYLALSTTPVGALAPMTSVPGPHGSVGRVQIHGQFGFMEQEGDFSTRNFALAATFPTQLFAIRLTAGVADFACDENGPFGPGAGITLDCGMGFFGGVDGTIPLIRPVLTSPSSAGFSALMVLSLGASTNDLVEIEFEDPTNPAFNGRIEASAMGYSAAVGVPLSFVVRSDDITVIPHLTPRIGFGQATMETRIDIDGLGESGERTDRGIRPMVGAGVDILFGRSGLGLGLGMQKVFAEDSDMVVGINLSFQRR